MYMQIEIDLDVHKAIEARRNAFDEKPNAILRRAFGIPTNGADLQASYKAPRERQSRSRGTYQLKLLGKKIECTSLKEVLRKSLLGIEEQHSGFIEKLANHRTARGRRLVARKAEELYPGKPNLVQHCAERLDQRWWFDTNVSFNQTNRYLSTMASVAGLREAPSVERD